MSEKTKHRKHLEDKFERAMAKRKPAKQTTPKVKPLPAKQTTGKTV